MTGIPQGMLRPAGPSGERLAALVPRIVEALVRAVRPVRVILHGPAVRGGWREGDPVDLLVVVRDDADEADANLAALIAAREVEPEAFPNVIGVSALEAMRDEPWLVYRTALGEGCEVFRADVVPDPDPGAPLPPDLEWLALAELTLDQAVLCAPDIGFDAAAFSACLAARRAVLAILQRVGIHHDRRGTLRDLLPLLAGVPGLDSHPALIKAQQLGRFAPLEWVPSLTPPVSKGPWRAAVARAKALVLLARSVAGLPPKKDYWW